MFDESSKTRLHLHSIFLFFVFTHLLPVFYKTDQNQFCMFDTLGMLREHSKLETTLLLVMVSDAPLVFSQHPACFDQSIKHGKLILIWQLNAVMVYISRKKGA